MIDPTPISPEVQVEAEPVAETKSKEKTAKKQDSDMGIWNYATYKGVSKSNGLLIGIFFILLVWMLLDLAFRTRFF